ncbi:hypothetical protein B0H67DRAFT_650316 [Lasiosphaeris hirsuta]|uniref:Ubiquitin-like protease family profile domain-containing protein n=1 Tax=Lasiosphaeris hirsuta TaxID=260670 RepID=A0AA39ZRC1_9PEZI|nr:hypothetical protein B0H67DRAFT_650316 [Lasiosphaeris hirsuta]
MAPPASQPTPRSDGGGERQDMVRNTGRDTGRDTSLDERLGQPLAQAVSDLRREAAAAAKRVSNSSDDSSGKSQVQARPKASRAWQRVRDAFDQSPHSLRFPLSITQSPETASIRCNLHFALWVLESVDIFGTMDTLEWVCDQVNDCRLAPDQASRMRSLAFLYRLPVSVLLFTLDDFRISTGRELCNALKLYANVPALQRDITNLLRPLLESYRADHGNKRYGYGKLAPRARLSDLLQQLAFFPNPIPTPNATPKPVGTPPAASQTSQTSQAAATLRSSTRNKQPVKGDRNEQADVAIFCAQQEGGLLKTSEKHTDQLHCDTIFASGNVVGAEPLAMAEHATPTASASPSTTTGWRPREPTRLSSQPGALKLKQNVSSTSSAVQTPPAPAGHEPSSPLRNSVGNSPAASIPSSKSAPSSLPVEDTGAPGANPPHTPRLDSAKHPPPNPSTNHSPSASSAPSNRDSTPVHPAPPAAVNLQRLGTKRLRDEATVAANACDDEQLEPRAKRVAQEDRAGDGVGRSPEDTGRLTIQVLQLGLDSLAPGQWLNDTAVNTIIHNIVRESASIGALDSTFLASVASTERARAEWACQCGYPQRPTILLPVCRSSHWLLFAWNHLQNTLSIYNPNKSFVTPGLDQQVSERLMWLANRGDAESPRPIPVQVNCAQQQNSTDCGVYIIQFVQCLLSGDEFPRELSTRRCESARSGWSYMLQRKIKSLAQPRGDGPRFSSLLRSPGTPVEATASTQPEPATESHHVKTVTSEDLRECLLDLRESRAAAARIGGKNRRLTNASKAMRVRQLEEMDSWTARALVAQFHLQTIEARYSRMSKRADEAVTAAMHQAARRRDLVNFQIDFLQAFLQHRSHLRVFDIAAGEPRGQPTSDKLDLALLSLESQAAHAIKLNESQQRLARLSHDGYQYCVRTVVLMLVKKKAEELKAMTEAGLAGARASIENPLRLTENQEATQVVSDRSFNLVAPE